jgi:hypothetical protein
MINVRKNIFETNSSSVHSLVIVPESKFKRFVEGELYYNSDDNEFITKEQAIEYVKEYLNEEDYDCIEDAFYEANIYSYDNLGDMDYSTYEYRYTTESGDNIVAFGYYGNAY